MAKRAQAKRKSASKARAASRRAAKRPAAKRPAAKRPAAKQPTAKRPAVDDFDIVVQVGKGLVSVRFRPTNSHYLFRIVENARAKPRSGAKPVNVELHTGTPGASGRYAEGEIADMSLELASAAVKDVLV
jgi:hypothetical protein